MVANIELVKGDTLSFGMEFQEYTDGLSSAYFSVKKNRTDKSYIFQKSLGNGITESSKTEYVIRVAPEDTENLEVGQYYYDLQISADGDVFTVLRGILNLYWPVTDEGADEANPIDGTDISY